MSHLIRQMGFVAFTTPDPDGSAQDLAELVGLKVTGRRGDTVFLSSNERRWEVALTRGDSRATLAIGLEASDAAAVDEIGRRVRSEGLEILDDRPLHDGIERAIRFATPWGPIFEVHTPIARDQAQRHIGPGARAKRIEHVNLKVPDRLAFSDLLVKLLGMELSDRTGGDEFRWFRAADGYHHTVALCPGDGDLHHYAFDFHALEDLAGIADGLVLKNRSLLWGPGRHGAGGNVFQYYVDPNGCVVEMSVGMDRIDNDLLYEPRSWTISPSLSDRWINLWGSPPPANFIDPALGFARSAAAADAA
ncbi:VOC family protein [Bosea sp. 2RAB26]|uniref:VOC family protein n=1 Tax=Bosea sp. 2RAB26 TaxID=3237476 RepID=UPI003F93D28A